MSLTLFSHYLTLYLNIWYKYVPNNNDDDDDDDNLVMLQSSLQYRDFFSDTWKAFTKHRIIRLNEYTGKRVSYMHIVKKKSILNQYCYHNCTSM